MIFFLWKKLNPRNVSRRIFFYWKKLDPQKGSQRIFSVEKTWPSEGLGKNLASRRGKVLDEFLSMKKNLTPRKGSKRFFFYGKKLNPSRRSLNEYFSMKKTLHLEGERSRQFFSLELDKFWPSEGSLKSIIFWEPLVESENFFLNFIK